MNAVAKIETKDVAVATPAYLLQMAVQQGADLDKLEKLMGLQERWEANEARKAFVNALTAFKSEPITINKNKSVSFSGTSYKHATLAEVVDAAAAALSRHGLTHRWNVEQKDDRITVECVLTHEQGHSERIAMSAPPDASGSKNKIQQIASTVTYLERYTLLAITGLAAKDQDDDGRGAQAEIEPSWFDALEAAADEASLRKVKADMVKAWKAPNKVPAALADAYNARRREITGAQHG